MLGQLRSGARRQRRSRGARPRTWTRASRRWSPMPSRQPQSQGRCVCFITAGPITKLFAWGEEESGGHGTREEPGTLTQGAPVFPGSSRLGIEPKTPGWLVQDPTTSPSGDLIPTIRGSGAHPGRGWEQLCLFSSLGAHAKNCRD